MHVFRECFSRAGAVSHGLTFLPRRYPLIAGNKFSTCEDSCPSSDSDGGGSGESAGANHSAAPSAPTPLATAMPTFTDGCVFNEGCVPVNTFEELKAALEDAVGPVHVEVRAERIEWTSTITIRAQRVDIVGGLDIASVLDAAGQTNLLELTEGAVVGLLANLEFRDGLSGEFSDGGGALQMQAGSRIGKIESCTFRGNVAQARGSEITGFGDVFGGALLLLDGSIIDEISGCLFEGNRVERLGSGGAIDLQTGARIGDIRGTTFRSNTAAYSGGAIFAGYGDSGVGIIQDCVFVDNRATKWHGGALGASVGYFDLIVGSVFRSNMAAREGSHIYNFKQKLTILDSEFHDGGIFIGANRETRAAALRKCIPLHWSPYLWTPYVAAPPDRGSMNLLF